MNKYPNIFDYSNFRVYLEDYRKALKASNPEKFTHEYICEKLGQPNSRSYYSDVIKGRKVTLTFIERFIGFLNLETEEANHFRAMVGYDQAEGAKEKEYYYGQLIRRATPNVRFADKESMLFYSQWYHSAIRTILDVIQFKGDDYSEITNKITPKISLKNIKESIKLLQDFNLVAEKDGFLKPTDKTFSTQDHVQDEIVKQYQVQCFEMAKAAIMSHETLPKDFSTNFLSISETGFRNLQELIKNFRNEVRVLIQNDKDPADRVYQFDIAIFPHTRNHSAKIKKTKISPDGQQHDTN
jgi:uncharacterized protein (TIGR02147 family)